MPEDNSRLLVVLMIAIAFISLLTIILIIKSKKALQDQIHVIENQRNQIAQKNEALGLHVESLKELNTEKNNVISMAAHDLRTPLNNMEGLVNLVFLEKNTLSEDQKTYLDLIQESSQKARESVNNILDVHKIESEFEQMVYTNENIVSVTNEIVAIFRPAASQKNIEITVETDHIQSNKFSTDKNYFKQILSNLPFQCHQVLRRRRHDCCIYY